MGWSWRRTGVTLARNFVVTLTSARLTTATRTEADGRFLFEGIPLGTFHLDLLDPVGCGIQKAEGSLTTNGQAFDAEASPWTTRPSRSRGSAPFTPRDGS